MIYGDFTKQTNKELQVGNMSGLEEEQIIIFCPYCLSPIDEHTTLLCPTCDEDITRDALVEMTQEEYLNEERISCRFCGSSILKLAPLCPSCHRWQAR